MSYLAHIADRVLNRPLLLLPEKAAIIVGVLSGRIGLNEPEANRFEGEQTPAKDSTGNVKRDRWGNALAEPFMLSNGVAIITVTGSLVNRGAWIGANSGLTSYEGVQQQLKRAAAHADVKSILLDLHTPGGEAIGAFETAAMVREIAQSKPVVAVVNGMAASAGYAIASGATEIVTTETGMSGSIGVVMMHADYSKYLEKEGINPTLIFAGDHKVDGHPFGPLPDTVKADIQSEIDAFYAAFLNTVAAGRGERLTADAARATQARTYIGPAAVAVGLADRVGTFESVLSDLSRAAGRTTSTKGKSMTEANGAPAAETNAGITQAQADANAAQAVTNAVAADRQRMAALDELAAECNGNADGLKLIADAKANGATAEATALQLVKAGAFKKAAVLGGLQQDDVSAQGAAPAAPGAAVSAAAATPEGWRAEWEASETLKAAYPSADVYVAYKKAEAGGKVRILEGRAGK